MQKTLLLVDGSSYLYRAFHALPDLRSPDGEPTGAIYGMLAMLRRLRHDFPSAYLACVFDAKGKTFRDELYSEYKANRAAMPEDLARQIPAIHEAIRILGWPIISIEGIEADDVIGTLAAEACAKGMDTVISTGDKDMTQLVNEHVTLVNTMSNEKLDREAVLSKFGVPPERMVDYLTLVGDTSDNVPGVPKVGPKTANKWLSQYGTLDGVIVHAQDIGGVVGENLRASLDWLSKARELVTIRTDCKLAEEKVPLESLTQRPEDKQALRAFFERHGFRSWLRELTAELQQEALQRPPAGTQADLFAPASTDASPVAASYETVLTEEALSKWLAEIDAAELTSLDTETDSLDPMQARLVGISLCCEPGRAAYIPLSHRYVGVPDQLPLEHVLNKLRPWLEDEKKKKVGQNLKYDRHILANHGIDLKGIAHDTLLQSYVLESHRRHDMDSLAQRHLDKKTITYEEVCGKGVGQVCFDQIDLERATEYAAEDADVALQLHRALWPRIEKDDKLRYVYEKIELPTQGTLFTMERNGVLIDAELLAGQSHELGRRMGELEYQAHEQAGEAFNLNSPKQLGEILFDKLKLPAAKKTASGAASTGEDVLQKLAEDYPLPKTVLEYRGLSKLKSTYTDKLPRMVNPKTGRVHTNFAQAVAVTGRLASNEPNLQNIPIRTGEGRRIREAFVAPPGSQIVSADYSQIELRIMAHISGDENLLRAFAHGEDVHRATAAEIFEVAPPEVTSDQRRYAKVINFGLIYGMSAFGVAANLGIGRTAAQSYIDRYFVRYPGVARYMADTREQARRDGFVETVFGRRLWLPEINSPNGPRRQAAERAAINAPMQGTAADIIKLSMVAVEKWLESEKLQSKLILQVHDELLLEVPEHELSLVRERLPELMSHVAKLKVPLTVEVGVGRSWGQAH